MKFICLILGHKYDDSLYEKWSQCSDLVLRRRYVRENLCKRCFTPVGVEESRVEMLKSMFALFSKSPF